MKLVWASHKGDLNRSRQTCFRYLSSFSSSLSRLLAFFFFRFHFHFSSLLAAAKPKSRIYFHSEQCPISLSFETGWWSSSWEKGKFRLALFHASICERERARKMKSENWRAREKVIWNVADMFHRCKTSVGWKSFAVFYRDSTLSARQISLLFHHRLDLHERARAHTNQPEELKPENPKPTVELVNNLW